jgi:hypothetical protein
MAQAAAEARDPNAMHKEQRDAILATIRPGPPTPADPIAASKAKIAELEAKARRGPEIADCERRLRPGAYEKSAGDQQSRR